MAKTRKNKIVKQAIKPAMHSWLTIRQSLNSMLTQKKAQIHMTETIMVLLIFFILLFFGIFIYYKYTAKDIQETAQETSEIKAHAFLNVLYSMPEFSCKESACIDSSKLLAFSQAYSQTQKFQEYYQDIFSYKTIIIEQIYPIYPETAQRECTIQNYPDCTKYTVYSNPNIGSQTQTIISVPVSLYFPVKDNYAIANIYLTIY